MSVTELIAKLQEISDGGQGDFVVQFETGGAAYDSDITTDGIRINVKKNQVLFEQEY